MNACEFIMKAIKPDDLVRLFEELGFEKSHNDNAEEAYKLLQSHGFCNAFGDGVIIEAEHFRGAHMASPSGFEIMVMQHIR